MLRHLKWHDNFINNIIEEKFKGREVEEDQDAVYFEQVKEKGNGKEVELRAENREELQWLHRKQHSS